MEGEIINDEIEYCSDGINICPDKWEFIKSNGMCKAPNDYNGYCDKLMDFSSFTDEAKLDWASSCDVHWKNCSELRKERGMGTKDSMDCKNGYNLSLCPYGFKFDKISQCIPVLGVYQGPCMVNMDFSEFSSNDKIEWSKSCKAYWPCNEDKYETFKVCPINWDLNAGFCIPPKGYKGPCKFKNKFTFYTKEMKKKFCEKCQIYCASESDEHMNEEDLNWDKPCPYGWKELDRGKEIWCKPGNDVKRCNTDMIFKSEEDKRAWASYCDQPWEPRDKSKLDYKIQSLIKGFSGPL